MNSKASSAAAVKTRPKKAPANNGKTTAPKSAGTRAKAASTSDNAKTAPASRRKSSDSGVVRAGQAKLRAAQARAQTSGKSAPASVTAATILGLSAGLAAGLPAAVASGLPFDVLDNLAEEIGLSTRELAEGFIGITRPTLSRRRKSGTLTQPESDAALRYARLLEQATGMMEDDEAAARRWLKTPLPILGDTSPLEHARTEAGGREVELLMGRLEHGVFS